MKFWDDSLRICPECKAKVNLGGNERKPCPRCGREVFFFDYRKLPDPPPLPELSKQGFLANSHSKLLLVAVVLLCLLALLSCMQGLFVAIACALVAVALAVFSIMRDTEAAAIEARLEHYTKVLELANAWRNQTDELVERYNGLLETADVRIQHYFKEIYEAAEREKQTAQRDRAAIQSVEQRIYAMAERLVNDHLKWMTDKLRADPENYQRKKTTLTKTFDFVESVGYKLPKEIRKTALAELKQAYQAKIREQTLKEEQRRLNQQMREEARLLREQEAEIREAEAQEAELAERLKEALAAQAGIHSQEVEDLQRQLAEAHANAERAKSQAQLTKVGHVYILSNIGSFGENVFKVGMTRRLDPSDRVKELGDASVPFPFDVHAMVQCEDAPRLENALHRELTSYRVNRVNLRKEYFSVELNIILAAVRRHHGVIEYIAEPEALEYRESQNISPEELTELTEELAEMGVSLDEDDEFS